MKNMKKITVMAALLLMFFAMAFAGEALAYPNWITPTTPLKGHNIVRTGKDINKSDYLSVSVGVTYRNNRDSGRILTALFDKTFTFYTFRISDPQNGLRWYNADGYQNVRRQSTKVNKIEVWPNATYKLIYYIPVNKLIRPSGSWRELNQYLLNHKDCKGFFTRWNHNFQVSSKNV